MLSDYQGPNISEEDIDLFDDIFKNRNDNDYQYAIDDSSSHLGINGTVYRRTNIEKLKEKISLLKQSSNTSSSESSIEEIKPIKDGMMHNWTKGSQPKKGLNLNPENSNIQETIKRTYVSPSTTYDRPNVRQNVRVLYTSNNPNNPNVG
jgi:hypothetical protein